MRKISEKILNKKTIVKVRRGRRGMVKYHTFALLNVGNFGSFVPMQV